MCGVLCANNATCLMWSMYVRVMFINFYMGCESAGNRQRTLEQSPNTYQQPLGT